MYTLEHSQDLSPTAVICENLQRFGGSPQKGEPDPRAVWDRDEALAGLGTILDTFVDEIAPDGTQLADERESLLWGFVNTLHMQTVRLDRAVDRLAPELKQLQRSQDGTEINAWELERIIERARNLGDRRDAFEQLRDDAAERYRADTGSTWRPRHGSHTSRTSKLTSAAIDARDFLRARENEKTQAHLPQGNREAGVREYTLRAQSGRPPLPVRRGPSCPPGFPGFEEHCRDCSRSLPNRAARARGCGLQAPLGRPPPLGQADPSCSPERPGSEEHYQDCSGSPPKPAACARE